MLTHADADQLWAAALGILQLETTRPNYETWLKDTTALRLEDGRLVIGTSSTFAAAMLEQRMASTILRALERVAGQAIDVTFEFVPPAGEQRDSRQHALPLEPLPGLLPNPVSEPGGGLRLNPNFTFDNFIVGPSNELAHAAATAVAEQPGTVYNPLYIWSDVGLGKTHLMQAIAHQLQARGMNVIYVSSERFTNEYITAIQERDTEQFRNRYRSTDALLIDDIQFIAGKQSTQEGFFHTFNELHTSRRQIVVTGDEPARRSMLEERIQSRLEGGLVADIQPPTYETRVAILHAKALALGLELNDSALEMLGNRSFINVRDLEGCLNRIVAYARIRNAPLTPDVISAALANFDTTARRAPAQPADVLNAVAGHFSVDLVALQSRRRDKRTALARQIAMYLLREDSGLSSTRIGLLLGGKDHSTVLYGCKRVEEELTSKTEVRHTIAQIRQAVAERHAA